MIRKKLKAIIAWPLLLIGLVGFTSNAIQLVLELTGVIKSSQAWIGYFQFMIDGVPMIDIATWQYKALTSLLGLCVLAWGWSILDKMKSKELQQHPSSESPSSIRTG